MDQRQTGGVTEEQHGDHHANQQATQGGGGNGGIDQVRAAVQIAQRCHTLGIDTFDGAILEQAHLVDDAPEPIGQHDQQDADTGKQEHGRDGQLDDLTDIAELDVHCNAVHGGKDDGSVAASICKTRVTSNASPRLNSARLCDMANRQNADSPASIRLLQ